MSRFAFPPHPDPPPQRGEGISAPSEGEGWGEGDAEPAAGEGDVKLRHDQAMRRHNQMRGNSAIRALGLCGRVNGASTIRLGKDLPLLSAAQHDELAFFLERG